jgi:hypothetical protein
LLTHVQFSAPPSQPFAILRAANGQELTAIGRGIFTIKHIRVVAYLFKDEDLVHNLLGMAPFADVGCTAVFTARDFELYHQQTLLIAGKRHSANLWHVELCRGPPIQGALDFPEGPPTARVLLLHEDTRRDKSYVQFVHACLGSPPPTTTPPVSRSLQQSTWIIPVECPSEDLKARFATWLLHGDRIFTSNR